MNLNLFKWFKKPEQINLPSRFAIIRYSKTAKDKGIFNEENKVVEIYENGKLKGTPQPYTEELINALIEVDEIPVTEENFEEEQFEFVESADFGFVKFRR